MKSKIYSIPCFWAGSFCSLSSHGQDWLRNWVSSVWRWTSSWLVLVWTLNLRDTKLITIVYKVRVNWLWAGIWGSENSCLSKGNVVTPIGADWGILLPIFYWTCVCNCLQCWKDEVSLSSWKLVVDPKYWVNGLICLHQCPRSTDPLLLQFGKDIISHHSDKM